MPSDAPNATWHPAFMPNSAKDLQKAASPLAVDTTAPPPVDVSDQQTGNEPDVLTVPDETTFDLPHDSHDDSGVDAWFPEYDAGSPWSGPPAASEEVNVSTTDKVASPVSLSASKPTPGQAGSSEPSVAHEPSPEIKATPNPASVPASEAVLESTPLPEAQPASEQPSEPEPTPVPEIVEDVATKHQSTISFTRTVSNDVNWDAEDDDAEWNLSRADTDPFKFLPPSDRTNSFPAVRNAVETPEAEPHHTSDPEPHPLESSEALSIVNEVDNAVERDFGHNISQDEPAHAAQLHPDSSAEKQTGSPTDAWNTNAEDTEDAAWLSSGGAGERFEEGVPLIPHEHGRATQEQEQHAKDPFAESDEEDDFFDKAEAATDSKEATETPANITPFERKSTLQVLQSVNGNSLNRQDSDLVASPQEMTWPTPPIDENKEAGTENQENDAATKPNGGSATDLAAQWAAALAEDDDDELLLEDTTAPETKELDPAAIFGDDDEGFLEDDAPELAPAGQQAVQPLPSQQQQQQQQQQQSSTASRYLPQNAQPAQAPQQQLQQPPNPYLPTAPSFVSAQPAIPAPKQFPVSYGYNSFQQPPQQQPQPGQPPAPKAQSFVDKSKGGYHSPYDLPMDVVKPVKKRQSMQQLPRASEPMSTPPQAPPRSASVRVASPVKGAYSPAPPLPPTGHTGPPLSQASAGNASRQPAKHESFFEDLPILNKPRPASRHSLPSPQQTSPYGPPPAASAFPQPPPQQQMGGPSLPYAHPTAQSSHALPSMPPPPSQYAPRPPAPPHPQAGTQPPSPEIAKLVAPPRLSPYGPSQSNLPVQESSAAAALGAQPPTRYSPSLSQLSPPNGAAAGAQPSRYSPAPPQRAPSGGGYGPVPTGVAPPILPHQPRTSSPLAHFEISYDKPRGSSTGQTAAHGDSQFPERRGSSSMYDSRLNRVPSLPPTREVEEEDASANSLQQQQQQQQPQPQQHPPPPASHANQHGGQYSPPKARQTPPPQANAYGPSTFSPPKRILSYTPHTEGNNAPPKRYQTQSPSALYGKRASTQPADAIPRPASVHGASSTPYAPHIPTMQPASVAAPPSSRPRASSQNLNLVPPTDGTESDPLQRWKGAPIFTWGVGGTFVSSFPQDVPRYGMNQALPMIHRAPGDVQAKNIKDLLPLEERLAKFPGPLKGKAKKKEVLAWLTTGIEVLERSAPRETLHLQLSLDDKRLEERVLLWKILRLFVEHDGILEGNPTVDKAVRDVLSPFAASEVASPDERSAASAAGAGAVGYQDAPGQTQADAVDSGVVEHIRKSLLLGDKEKAVWDAVDKRLWGHAFLIAGAASRELFKKVTQEFVRKEVNTPGLSNESLAALYEVLSGNHEECVDELVPVHARAGLQLMTTQPSVGQTRDEFAGLDKWRETLCLVLSNRSVDDVQAINSLGNLLSGYGRAEAAHVCYLFSRNVTVFGGLDDPAAGFVLLGADHKRQADSFAKEIDAVLLSEVYEYGLSLTGGIAAMSGTPHLAAYKLQHAASLAEYGLRDKALQYCEAIVGAMNAQTRRSPYHHPVLEAAVDDLMKRLKQAPKEESNSWIPKPSMNKVSDTVWNRFNKFVAGDDAEGAAAGGDGDGATESGPFARIAGGTPTISRPTSAGNGATGMEMFGGQAVGTMPVPIPVPSYGMHNGATPAPLSSSAPLPVPTTRAASRYAPSSGQPAAPAPAPPKPYEPSTGYAPAANNLYPAATTAHTSYEPPSLLRQSSESVAAAAATGYNPSYMPNNVPSTSSGPSESGRSFSRDSSSFVPVAQTDAGAPQMSYAAPPKETSAFNPYAPASESQPANGTHYAPPAAASASASASASAPPSQEGKVDSQPDFGYQAPSYGYEPPSMAAPLEAASDEPATETQPTEDSVNAGGGYEPPSFQPYSYEPPSYEPDNADSHESAANGDAESKPKKKSFLDDDEDVDALSAPRRPTEKTKEERDRENAELVRKVAEEDAKRAAAEKEAKAKKGWGLTSWFGGGGGSKKDNGSIGGTGSSSGGGGGSGGGSGSEGGPPKAIRANLGEKSSFYFDPELKRWVNKNAGAGDQASSAASTPPPPPPRSASASQSGLGGATPPPPRGTPPPPRSTAGLGSSGRAAPPPPAPPPSGGAAAAASSAPPNLAPIGGGPPTMTRTPSNTSAASGPPSRPATRMSDANSIDDLLGAAGPRKAGGTKRGRKGGRYVDVMAK